VILIKTLLNSFIFLFIFVAGAQASDLIQTMQLERAAIDQMTATQQTLNNVTLLHLGKNTAPARQELIAASQRYIFTSVPYWHDDSAGESIFASLAAKRAENPLLDVRILEDWTSPGSTGDFWATKMFKRLKQLTNGNAYLWNTPWWGRRFSSRLLANRMHDKTLIIDGTQLLTGGMNVGQPYFEGGLTREGWHDTDLLIQGPAAAETTRTFVKVWEMARYLRNPKNLFPTKKSEVNSILQNYFYQNQEKFSFKHLNDKTKQIVTVNAQVPFLEQLKQLGVDRDARSNDPVEGGLPVRMIYDNPLFNPVTKSGKKYFCDFACFLDYAFNRTQESIRIFQPYLTISAQHEKLLVQTAQRGIKVEIITNSRKSHDLGEPAYFAAISHYPALLAAGVKIYEWQGHKPLLELERSNNCIIPVGEWPGGTLHTKVVMMDGQVGVVGSHNMNVRSEKYNSELMTIVMDSNFTSQLNAIFEKDLDLDEDRSIFCGEQRLPRSRLVNEIDLESTQEFIKKNRAKIDFYKKLQALM
jgi:phosphatidylserine/phosphatidylglycerophosphate/cardiolipin synthase-like enzyme